MLRCWHYFVGSLASSLPPSSNLKSFGGSLMQTFFVAIIIFFVTIASSSVTANGEFSEIISKCPRLTSALEKTFNNLSIDEKKLVDAPREVMHQFGSNIVSYVKEYGFADSLHATQADIIYDDNNYEWEQSIPFLGSAMLMIGVTGNSIHKEYVEDELGYSDKVFIISHHYRQCFIECSKEIFDAFHVASSFGVKCLTDDDKGCFGAQYAVARSTSGEDVVQREKYIHDAGVIFNIFGNGVLSSMNLAGTPNHENVGEQGGSYSEFGYDSPIGFSYIIGDDTAYCMEIKLNPGELFCQLSDTITLDMSSLEMLRKHPYFQGFHVYIRRYGDCNTPSVSIDFQAKDADQQHASDIGIDGSGEIDSSGEIDGVLIPLAGRRLIVSCESDNDKPIIIMVKNNKSASMKALLSSFCFPVTDFMKNGANGFGIHLTALTLLESFSSMYSPVIGIGAQLAKFGVRKVSDFSQVRRTNKQSLFLLSIAYLLSSVSKTSAHALIGLWRNVRINMFSSGGRCYQYSRAVTVSDYAPIRDSYCHKETRLCWYPSNWSFMRGTIRGTSNGWWREPTVAVAGGKLGEVCRGYRMTGCNNDGTVAFAFKSKYEGLRCFYRYLHKYCPSSAAESDPALCKICSTARYPTGPCRPPTTIAPTTIAPTTTTPTTPDATTTAATTTYATAPGATSPNATSPNATTTDARDPGATSPNATTIAATTIAATTPGGTSPNATTTDATDPGATSPNATTIAATTIAATTPGGTTPNATITDATTIAATAPASIATAPINTNSTVLGQRTIAPSITVHPNAVVHQLGPRLHNETLVHQDEPAFMQANPQAYLQENRPVMMEVEPEAVGWLGMPLGTTIGIAVGAVIAAPVACLWAYDAWYLKRDDWSRAPIRRVNNLVQYLRGQNTKQPDESNRYKTNDNQEDSMEQMLDKKTVDTANTKPEEITEFLKSSREVDYTKQPSKSLLSRFKYRFFTERTYEKRAAAIEMDQVH
ncbi:MAG: hypothetical protein QS721_03555 [Candidatus Endonucleobacter sp. (ex Gigantidas childressi)]|nr:hypothetical protein [Candidatus Endonucleobacter sp. (ex Gigantidas childressi)]